MYLNARYPVGESHELTIDERLDLLEEETWAAILQRYQTALQRYQAILQRYRALLQQYRVEQATVDHQERLKRDTICQSVEREAIHAEREMERFKELMGEWRMGRADGHG